MPLTHTASALRGDLELLKRELQGRSGDDLLHAIEVATNLEPSDFTKVLATLVKLMAGESPRIRESVRDGILHGIGSEADSAFRELLYSHHSGSATLSLKERMSVLKFLRFRAVAFVSQRHQPLAAAIEKHLASEDFDERRIAARLLLEHPFRFLGNIAPMIYWLAEEDVQLACRAILALNQVAYLHLNELQKALTDPADIVHRAGYTGDREEERTAWVKSRLNEILRDVPEGPHK